MNKIFKILFIIAFTFLIPAVTFIAILNSKPTQNPSEISKAASIHSEVRLNHPIRVFDDPLQEIFEKEMEEKLLSRSSEAGFDSPPPELEFNENDEFPFDSITINELEKNSGRRLEDGITENTLTGPGIIAFDHQTKTNAKYYAYAHIFKNLEEYTSKFIVYPFKFSYTPTSEDGNAEKVDFHKGAVFSLNPDDLPTDSSASSYFKSYIDDTDVSFGKAKALHDINIAILSVEDIYEDMNMNLLYEASSYCEFLSTYLGKYSQCMEAKNYYEFKEDKTNAGKMALVMITPAEIEESLLLTKDNSPRFQLLIVADHYAGSYSRINNKLGYGAIEKIKEYVKHGGQIHAYGKSGYLLESWKLLPNGMYDTSTLMASTNSILEEKIDGCNNINSDSNNDFWKSLLCMNFDSYDGYGKSFLLSAYKVNSDKTSGVKTLLSYDSASATLRFKNLDGLMSELSSTDKDFLPFIMEATHESGKIMLINGNPLFKNTYNEIFYNLLFMPMSRSVAFDYYLGTKDNNPIPGGEAGILLKFSLSFINVYNKDINGLKTHIWLPDNIGFVEPLPENCEITPYENPTFEKDLTLANASCHVQCATDSLSAFNKFEKIITIEILHMAKPTPRLTPLASRSIRVEMTWPKGFSIFSSSCSSMDTGRLEMYRLVGSCSCCCGEINIYVC